MTRSIFRKKNLALAAAAVFAVGCWIVGVESQAQAEFARHSTAGDLFYNYYAPPVGPGSVGAQMYPCPRPTPPLVGPTYITYQPLLPHEMLYKHHRVYKTKHEDAPKTRTTVHWR